jgi:hypothetical protein
MTKGRIFCAALAAALLGACGGEEPDAGASVEPGTVGSAEAGTAPNAPPAMTSPATEGDTTVRTAAPGH